MTETDLAERLLAHHFGGSARAYVGRIPDHTNVSLPLPREARLVGSVLTGAEDDPDAINLYLETGSKPDVVLGFFDDALAEAGFHATGPSEPRMGRQGFVPSRQMVDGRMRLYCRGESGPYYSVSLRPAGTDLIVSLHWSSGRMGFSPCATDAPGRHGPPDMDTLPTLEGPDGVPLRGGGGGGSPDHWTSYGTAFTKMAARDLLGHFVPQLERQGVAVDDTGDAGPVAWCRGQMRDQERRIFLLIFEQWEEVRSLTLVSMTPHAERNVRRMYDSGWSARHF